MIRIAMVALRADWRLWSGPLVVVTSASMLVSLVATYWVSLGTPQAVGALSEVSRTLNEVRSTSYVLYVVIALSVIVVLSSNTAVTIRAQRHALATLRLAGARPRQVRGAITLQVLVMAGIGSVLGFVAALPLQQPAMDVLVRMSTRTDVRIDAWPNPFVFLIALCGTVAICWIAAFRPARIAATTPAIAAIRDESEAQTRMGASRWIGFGLAAVMFLMIFIGAVASVYYVSSSGEALAAGASNAITLGFALLAMLGFAAPVLLPPIIKVWTACIPASLSPSWYLARRSALYRFSLSSTTVVPLLVGFGLFGILFGSIATWSTALSLTGSTEPLNTLDTYVVLAPVALITGIGSVTNLFMTGRGRERELALVRTAGALPTTLRALLAWEALIYVVTALLVAVAASLVTILTQSLTYLLSGAPFAPRIDLIQLVVLGPLAYLAMLTVIAVPARSASRRSLRSVLSPA